jgi:glycine/D-amino acid oxidase-like deaminating enzyme
VNKHIDTLIVGQGLAGSLLAWTLLQRGRSVCVVDAGRPHSTSRTAAGLVNPVTGQNLTRLWRAEDFLASARRLYAQLGEQFGRRFYIEKPMLRLFRLEKERKRWETRREDPAYADYLGEAFAPGQGPAPYHSPLGGFWQKQTGYLTTQALLDALRDWLRDRGCLIEADFDYADVQLSDGVAVWRGIEARQIVFCEGYRALNNPWFQNLPLRPVKGEILTLRLQAELPDAILNAGKWLLPLADGSCRFGATYERGTLDESPSEQGRAALLEALQDLLDEPCAVEVLDHRAGLRPGTQDRRPLLGLHAEHPAVGIFNGFGSKGSLLIPWHAERMADMLCNGTPLPEDSAIQRFS